MAGMGIVAKDYKGGAPNVAHNDLVAILKKITAKPFRRPTPGSKAFCFEGIKPEDYLNLGAIGSDWSDVLSKTKTSNSYMLQEIVDAVNSYLEEMLKPQASGGTKLFGLEELAAAGDVVAIDLLAYLRDLKNFYEVTVGSSGMTFKAELQNAITTGNNTQAWGLLLVLIPKVISADLITALEADNGVRPITLRRTPPKNNGGKLLIDDDDQDNPDPSATYKFHGEKISLKNTVEAEDDPVIQDKTKIKTLLEAKTTSNLNKVSGSKPITHADRWEPEQQALNIRYVEHTAKPKLKLKVQGAKVVGTVIKDQANFDNTAADIEANRENLYVVTPYNDTDKKVSLVCNPGSIAGEDFHQNLDMTYPGVEQAKDSITEALRILCSDPKFATATSIVVKSGLCNWSDPDAPFIDARDTEEDAVKLVKVCLLAMNAEPRVIPKLTAKDWKVLKTHDSHAYVGAFVDWYERHNIYGKTHRPTTATGPQFTAAEMKDLHADYERTFTLINLAKLKRA